MKTEWAIKSGQSRDTGDIRNRTNTSKTEWAIKSGQSSDTGDIGNRTNTNKRKKHNTTQKTKMVSKTDPTKKNWE
jgi:nitrogen fixation-related uncharacterized protein